MDAPVGQAQVREFGSYFRDKKYVQPTSSQETRNRTASLLSPAKPTITELTYDSNDRMPKAWFDDFGRIDQGREIITLEQGVGDKQSIPFSLMPPIPIGLRSVWIFNWNSFGEWGGCLGSRNRVLPASSAFQCLA